MKKKIFMSIAIIAITAIGFISIANSTYATISSDCPNGCVEGSGGCHCNGDYPDLREAKWKKPSLEQVE
ncbi:MAG: hypothetical protein AB7S48_06735 [Bacteroidales bacterium]